MEFTFPGGLVAIAETYEAALAHLKEFHPRVYERVAAGEVPVTVSDPTEQARIATVLTDEKIQARFLKILLTDRFELENRVRVLEGKPQITREQYIAAVKTRIGL